MIDNETGEVPEGLVLRREKDTLKIEIDDEALAQIDDFYSDDAAATFSADGSFTPVETMALHSSDEAVTDAQTNVVWQASDMAAEDTGGLTTWQLAGGTALGVGGIAGIAAAGGGGSASTGAASYVVTLAAAAGPFEGIVTVELYDQDGNLLHSGQHDFSNGNFEIPISNGYVGPLLAIVIDSNGADGDYMDEASNTLIDLGEPLRAMTTADGSGNVFLSVTPLTELAVRHAGIGNDNIVTDADLDVNGQIAELFGIDDITGPVTTVIEDDYNAGDGLSAAEQYGNILAMLSGSDQETGSVDATLDQLEACVSDQGDGNLALTQDAVDLLSDGVDNFEAGANAGEADLTDSLIQPPVIDAATGGINAVERDAGVIVGVTGAVAGDEVIIFWGDQTHTVTISAGDINGDGLAEITVPGSKVDSAGPGDISVTFQINGGEVSPGVIISVDTTLPNITDVSIPDTAMTVGDTVTATITVDDDGGDTYTNISGTIGGFALGSISRTNSTTYTAQFTITDGGTDVTSGNDIPVSVTLDDASGNTSTSYTTAISQGGDPIDANIPSITAVSIPDAAMSVGDTVTVTITVDDDGGDVYANLSGTIGGFALTNLSRTNSTTYTAQFTVTENGNDVTAVSDIPVSICLDDSAGSTSDTFTTPISQANDVIDANSPTLDNVSPADNAAGVGATDNLTMTFSENVGVGTGNLVIYDSGNNVFETIDITSGFVTGWGSPTLTINPSGSFADNTSYYVKFPEGAIFDFAGNSVAAIADTTTWNFATPDNTAPAVSFVDVPANDSYVAGDTLDFTVNFDENIILTGTSSTLGLTLQTGGTVQAAYQSHTTDSITYRYTVLDTQEDTDGISVGAITINTDTIEDASGNTADLTLNSIGDTTAVLVDAVDPVITAVSIPDAAMSVGDTVTVTITVDDDGGDTYTNVSGTIGGFALTNLSKTNSTTYTAQFTVTDGGTDVAPGNDISVSVTLDDSAGNTSTSYTTAISQGSDPIDANAPIITAVSIPDTGMAIGDTVSVTITVDDDGGDVYTNVSGTIGGFALTNLSRTNSTTYSAQFTVTENGTDVAAVSDIPISITLDDSAGSTANTYITPISQANDVIDANSPAVSCVDVPVNDTYDVGQTMTFTVNFDGNIIVGGTNNSTLELVLASGTVQATYQSSDSTSITYAHTIESGDLDGNGITVNALNLNSNTVTDGAGNALNTALNSVGDTSGVLVDGVGPLVTLGMDNTAPTEAGTDTVTITATLAETYTSDVTVNLEYSGTADGNGTDYSNGASSITISAGQTTGTTSLTVVDDGDTDPGETIIVDITSVTNGIENGTQQQTATITDDEGLVVDTSIVVFDLVGGASSDHSGRAFDGNTSYTIYVRVPNNINDNVSGAERWTGASNLGGDDEIFVVGEGPGGAGVNNFFQAGDVLRWKVGTQTAFSLTTRGWTGPSSRSSSVFTASSIWTGSWEFRTGAITVNNFYKSQLPTGVLTSQGLA